MPHPRQPPPYLVPYLQLFDAEKQVMRFHDERRMREARLHEVDNSITDARHQLSRREMAIAAIEARVGRIEETMDLIQSGALLEPVGNSSPAMAVGK